MSQDETFRPQVRGRGAGENRKGRFEKLEVVYEPQEDEEPHQVPTEIYDDTSRTIIAHNDSPDVGFTSSLNPYRGCEHGCIYCFARPTHEYLGYSCGIDFETKLFVKRQAPALLRDALAAKSWQPQVLVMSGVTDCYQPVERKLEITRQCLQVLAECRNPTVIITKNFLVTRDIDVLSELAQYNAIHVVVSITTLDKEVARKMEPRASRPELRLRAIEMLAKAGVRVGVNMAPIVPGLTDHEIPSILKSAADAGAQSAGWTMVRLPYGVKDLFQTWLEDHFPLRKKKVLSHIMETRGGKLYSAEFGNRMRGDGIYAEQIEQMFALYKQKFGLDRKQPPLSTEHFRRPPGPQLSLFAS